VSGAQYRFKKLGTWIRLLPRALLVADFIDSIDPKRTFSKGATR
jgi:hypothetical protein